MYNPYKRFHIINRVCFRGLLPKVRIRVIKRMPKEYSGSMGYFHYEGGKAKEIVLLEYKKRGNMTLTLLHEMLHFRALLSKKKYPGRHSKIFNKREWREANKLIPYCKEIIGCRV